jgi:hypothetical protein
LKRLVDAGRFADCAASIARINELLDDLIQRRRTHRIFCDGRVSDYRCRKESFNRQLSKSTFPGRGPIFVQTDVENVLGLAETIRHFERPPNCGFLERVGDGCVAAGRTGEAKPYYDAALETAIADGRPTSTTNRLRRKISL